MCYKDTSLWVQYYIIKKKLFLGLDSAFFLPLCLSHWTAAILPVFVLTMVNIAFFSAARKGQNKKDMIFFIHDSKFMQKLYFPNELSILHFGVSAELSTTVWY